MSSFIKRTASHFNSCLRSASQMSVHSFRQFNIGPVPHQDKIDKLKMSLVFQQNPFSAFLQPQKNGYRFERAEETAGKMPFNRYFAFGIAGFAVASLMFNKLEIHATEKPDVSDQEELDAIAKKQGELWECIGRTPDEYGGYIYHYKFREKYRIREEDDIKTKKDRETALSKKIDEIFPAVEPLPVPFDPKADHFRDFKDLGYSYREDKSGVYTSLPDKEALEARFEKRRELHPSLKPLKVFSSEGVADDLSYAEAYLNYDVLLSSGKEFVHDHFAHIIPTISLMFTPSVYTNNYFHFFDERDRIRKIISKIICSIKTAEEVMEKNELAYIKLKDELPMLKTALGASVDILWNTSDTEKEYLRGLKYDNFVLRFLDILCYGRFGRYAENKFGRQVYRLDKLWDQVKTLEKKHISGLLYEQNPAWFIIV